MLWDDDFERARLAREAENQQRGERCKALLRELDRVVQRCFVLMTMRYGANRRLLRAILSMGIAIRRVS